MVTNINHQELLDRRDKVIDTIFENFNSWDGNMESGIRVIDVNGVELDKLETINLQLSRFPVAYNEDYINKINRILVKQKEIHQDIKNQQETLLAKLQQISKKDQVIKSYMSINKESVFIDKDIE